MNKISDGTFGEIFIGYVNPNKQKVAIKKFKYELHSDYLLIEALLLTDCKHSNIVKIYGVYFLKNYKINSVIIEYIKVIKL